MSRRLTYEFVRNEFEKEGYELLNEGYKNNRQKLSYICPNVHKHSITWADWSQGRRCPICAGNVKKTIEFIKSEFANDGYVLLTAEYKNCDQKLNCVCLNNHECNISWNCWQRGIRCPYCAGVVKKTTEFIRSEFEKEGWVLKSTEYMNNYTKLDCICPNGHNHNINWNNWQAGYRCPYCAGNAKKTIEFIRSEFEKEGYILLAVEYKNAFQKLDYTCFNGHEHSICWHDWEQGNRCPYCANRPPITIEFIRAEFAKDGYILLADKYKNTKQKLSYVCPKGHTHSISWGNWSQGKRCPECFGKISKGEVQVRNFIKSLGVEVSPNDRNQIFNPETGNGLELDIFMPDLNKAIEYNGEYWHQDKNRDLIKQKLCESENIDLLTIWDREWLNKTKMCKEKIMKFMF